MALEVSSQKLAEVLLDFGLAPGNFPVRLGEPRELYSQLNTVALWALGRIPDDVDGDATDLTEAARLFVRRACFAPDNNHYQVMALTPKAFAPDELRSRYRSLIRLTHPDRGVPGLPGNAAGVVNRAHEILSDPELRSQYDDHLAERAAVAPAPRHEMGDGPKIRRIEQSHGFGDRWYSIKARFPKLIGLVVSIGGVSAVAIALLLWAAHDGQEGRMLVISGTEPEAERGAAEITNRSQSSKRDVAAAPERSADKPLSTDAPTRLAAAPIAATDATARRTPPPQALSTQLVQSASPARPIDRSVAEGSGTPSTATPASPPAAPSPVPPPSKTSVVASAPPAPPPPPPPKVVVELVEQARTTAPALKVAPSPVAPAEPLDSQLTARAPASSPPSGMIKTEQVAAPSPPPAPVPAPAPVATAAAPASTPTKSSPPPAHAPSPPPAPVAPRVVMASAAPTPAPPPARPPAAPQPVADTPAPQTPVVQTDKTWDVDAVRAKHYLIELVSKLSNPTATKATNTYLAGLNVTGSLFRPALTLMDRYSEISVESMRWTDTEQPGVLRVRGEIVLHARSPREGARSVSYGLSAEFWGTRSGTVLANLNLRERE